MDIFDILLPPIYLLVILFLAYKYKLKHQHEHIAYKYFLKLVCKLVQRSSIRLVFCLCSVKFQKQDLNI